MVFINRVKELAALEHWWANDRRAGVVWGRRRVGKTALLERFSAHKRCVFHSGAVRGELEELRLLTLSVAAVDRTGTRDLLARPYTNWDDAFDDLAQRTADSPLLVVLDEFPDLVASSPGLPGIIRAFLDRTGNNRSLRLLLCGSAVRYMQAMQEERQPLYGRFDLALLLHPFDPHDAAKMLRSLTPADRALAYGIVGGMPLYLSWWDQQASVAMNVRRLLCEPGARLLTELDLVLRTDIDGGEFAAQVLTGIANGRTTHNELKDFVRAEPTRTLDRLIELRMIERLAPVGQSERSRRRSYRIIDPFVAFSLGVVAKHRTEIERGLGQPIAKVLLTEIDDHMGLVWEEAFRAHLRRLASDDQLVGPDGEPIVAIGPWWDGTNVNEIDALCLSGRSSRPALVGEAKWAKSVDGRSIETSLRQKVRDGLGIDPADVRYTIAARSTVTRASPNTLTFTANDLFGTA